MSQKLPGFSWRVRRAALGIRQRDVADRAGISQSKYSLLERGDAFPTQAERDAIEEALRFPNSGDNAEVAVR